MLASPPRPDPDLRRTVRRLTEAAAVAERDRELRRNIAACWITATAWLFERIEQNWLLEFLLLGTLTLERGWQEVFVPGVPPFAVPTLLLRVGDEAVALRPRARHEAPTTLYLTLRNAARGGPGCDLLCEAAAAHPAWAVVQREQGLRRLLESWLPQRTAPLDERLFREELERALTGPQPVLGRSPDETRLALSRLLDHLTSHAVRHRFAQGVRSSAGRVGRQLRLAAPAVRQSALRTLPAFGRTEPLLPEAAPAESPDGAAGRRGAGFS